MLIIFFCIVGMRQKHHIRFVHPKTFSWLARRHTVCSFKSNPCLLDPGLSSHLEHAAENLLISCLLPLQKDRRSLPKGRKMMGNLGKQLQRNPDENFQRRADETEIAEIRAKPLEIEGDRPRLPQRNRSFLAYILAPSRLPYLDLVGAHKALQYHLWKSSGLRPSWTQFGHKVFFSPTRSWRQSNTK